MEGVGSRLGRASSRYGTSASAAVFSGPVRKWKRKWVNVSLNNRKGSLSNGQKNNGHSSSNSSNSRLLLCRWTPLPSTAAEEEAEEGPPRRRFCYTPVVVLEERKKAAKKVEPDGNKTGTDLFSSWKTSQTDKLNEEALKKESQDPATTHLDLGLSLKDNSGDLIQMIG